jgi:hypothetical protein
VGIQPRLNEGVWLAQLYVEGNHDPENGVNIEGGHIKLRTGPRARLSSPTKACFGAPVASFS